MEVQMKNLIHAADLKSSIPSRGVHGAVSRPWAVPTIASAWVTSLSRQSAGRPCRAQQASVADADIQHTESARREHAEVSNAFRPSDIRGRSRRIGVAVVALLTCAVITDAAPAWADPDPLVNASTDTPAVVWVPSAPPATATSTDGWTIAVSANNESQTPAPPLAPAVPSPDYIVGGVFSGLLHAPDPKTTAAPSGTLEVGYQVQCFGGGMMADLKPNSARVEVVKQSFTGFNPTVVVTAFHVQPDCVGKAAIRSYAILTRLANSAASVASYYGVSVPVADEG
jgi:MspA